MDIALPIVLGFLIGYGTNRVAIAMLFRPRRRTRVLGVTFWGLFPRLQPEFAEQAGELVAREFFHVEAVHGHIESMRETPALRGAMRRLIEQNVNAELGTAGEFLARVAGPDAAEAMRRRTTDEVARMLRDTLASDGGQARLAELLVPRLVVLLNRPLRDVLQRIAEQQPPDPDEPPRHSETDRLGRVLGVPKLLRWLSATELPRAFAERAVRYGIDSLQKQPRLADILPEGAQERLGLWLAQGAPAMQRSLAEQLERGTLRKVVADELRSAVRGKVADWTGPVPIVGTWVNPDRVLGLVTGVLDRMPDELAKVVRMPGTERALRSVLAETIADVLKREPRQFLLAVDESVHEQVVGWMGDRMAAGLHAEAVVAEIDDLVHENLRDVLDRPAGLWLASAWGIEDGAADGNGADVNAAAPSDAIRAVAERAVAHLLRQLESDGLAKQLREVTQAVVDDLWQRPLGRPRDWLSGEPEEWLEWMAGRLSDSVARTVQAHLGEVLDSLNIKELVRKNIAEWEPAKLEEAVYEVSKKHLGFVAWFGGFLGATIGLVQVGLQALR